MIVVFLETPEQIAALQAHVDNWRSLTLIAVTPAADFMLEKQGVAYRSIESFMPDATLIAEGDANIDLIEIVADRFDAVLHQAAAGIARCEWVSLRSMFHPIKGFFDALINRSLPILAAFDALQPAEIIAFRRPPYQIFGVELLDKPSWSLTTHLAPMIAQVRGTAMRWIDDPTPSPNIHDYTPPPSQSAPPQAYPAGRPQPDAPLMVHSLFADLGSDLMDYWIGALGGGQESLQNALFSNLQITDQEKAKIAVKTAVDAVCGDPEIRLLFNKGGNNIFPFVAGYLQFIALNCLPSMLSIAGGLEIKLRELGARTVIVTAGMTRLNYLVGRAASETGAPFVSYHYGGFLGYSLLPMHERYDMAHADFFLVGGEGSRRTFIEPSSFARWRRGVKRATPVATGMPWVDKAKADLRQAAAEREPTRQGPRRLMYVISALPGDNRYFGYAYLPDLQFWRFQRRFVERVLRRDDVRLVLKPPLSFRYPQLETPLFDWLKENVDPNRYDVVRDIRLDECMDKADAFFHDSSSTPLLYLAASNKPFSLYVDQAAFRLTPRAKELLKRRTAFLSETEEQLFTDLDHFLDLPEWTASADDGFLREFAVCDDDGKSTERAARFIWNTALGERQPPTV